MSFTIHGIARTRTSRVLWMAQELGVPYTHVKTAPGEGGTRSPAFRALSPMGRVPVLEMDGLVLTESLAINLHLAKAFETPLGPRTKDEDGLMTMWTLFAATELEPNAHEVLVHTLNRPEPDRDPSARDAALAALARPLAALDAALVAGGGHLVGGRFTVADLNVASILFYLRAAPGALDATPAVAALWEAAQARPAYAAMMRLREEG
ncbi:glutathione S-transferase family protein [Salinarimonas sp. NSM]|uniref:glutathione S-transferase family protein n=1 Tax=Salinarimonas sp. NSM TaxID=3458003 RepID=UPI004036AAF8